MWGHWGESVCLKLGIIPEGHFVPRVPLFYWIDTQSLIRARRRPKEAPPMSAGPWFDTDAFELGYECFRLEKPLAVRLFSSNKRGMVIKSFINQMSSVFPGTQSPSPSSDLVPRCEGISTLLLNREVELLSLWSKDAWRELYSLVADIMICLSLKG